MAGAAHNSVDMAGARSYIWDVRGLVLLVGLCLTACQFDESGLAAVSDSGGVSSPDAAIVVIDGASVVDAVVPIDAHVAPCVDSDGDTFLVINQPDANCPGPLDCDDDDVDAYPGQESYYDMERTSGGYDYNCDGEETRFNTTGGGNCRFEWWECLGTGWVNGVPECGQLGTYHVCEDVGGDCQETSRVDANMLCR